MLQPKFIFRVPMVYSFKMFTLKYFCKKLKVNIAMSAIAEGKFAKTSFIFSASAIFKAISLNVYTSLSDI